MSLPPSPPPDTCWLFLVRHGATANNLLEPPRLQGRGSDQPLSADGRRQADQVAALLSQFNLMAVYASPLVRAKETAAAIARQHGLAVTELAELIECDVGEWEGRTRDEIERNDSELYKKFQAAPESCGYRGGENLAQVRDRALPSLERVMAKHVGQSIAAVSHNVVNRTVIASAMGLPLACAREGIHQHNGGVNLLTYRAGHLKPLVVNSTFHLTGW